jgi:hypothetical protein
MTKTSRKTNIKLIPKDDSTIKSLDNQSLYKELREPLFME